MLNSSKYLFIEMLKNEEDKVINLLADIKSKKFYVEKIIRKPCNSDIYRQIMGNSHPKIAKVISVSEDDETVTIIEEYIQGKTCDELVGNHGLDEQDVVSYACDICDALSHLHQQNPKIIHRDIKPENIIIKEGQAYLIDFDISRTFDNTKNKDTQILGSVGYAAPEQFGFGQSDERSDIYALGSLINYLRIGKLPSEEISEGNLKRIIERCIKIDPSQRYPSANELRCDLVKLKNKTAVQRIKKLCRIPKLDIPGFTSGNLLYSGISLFMYAVFISMFFTIEFETTVGSSDATIELWLLRIVVLIWGIVCIAIVSDYHGIGKRLTPKLIRNKCGIFVYRLILSYVSLLPLLLLESIIYSFFR